MIRPIAEVSVIIPAYNAVRFIREAVDSALGQVGVTVEVIVIDNQSTDGTSNLVQETYGDSVQLVSEPKRGCAAARNAGLRVATGKYIALLDADDIWHPDKLRLQAVVLASRGDEGLVFCYGREFLDPNLTDQEKLTCACRPDPYAYLAPSALICSRATFDRVGEFPEVPIGEFISWYGWAKSLGLGTFILPDVLIQRRAHLNNTSRDPKALASYAWSIKGLLDRRRQAQKAQVASAESL